MDAVEVAFEGIEVSGPEAAKRGKPFVDFLKGLGFEAVEAALGIDRGFDEACVTKDAEVFGNGGLRHAQLALDFADGLLGRHEQAQDCATVWLRDNFEDGLHTPFILLFVYACQGIFQPGAGDG